MRCPFHPLVATVARKRPWSFCHKCRWQVTPKRIHPWPNEVRVGWLCHCLGIVWEPYRKRAHMQLVRKHSVRVVSACWVSVDWSRPKEWNECAWAYLHFKNKKQKRRWRMNSWTFSPNPLTQGKSHHHHWLFVFFSLLLWLHLCPFLFVCNFMFGCGIQICLFVE